jgi:hypothetical protein
LIIYHSSGDSLVVQESFQCLVKSPLGVISEVARNDGSLCIPEKLYEDAEAAQAQGLKAIRYWTLPLRWRPSRVLATLYCDVPEYPWCGKPYVANQGANTRVNRRADEMANTRATDMAIQRAVQMVNTRATDMAIQGGRQYGKP